MSDKTYRKGNEWTSELDVCVVSPAVVSRVSGFSVLREESLPSDHVPVNVKISLPSVDTENLLVRSHRLGEHMVCLPRNNACVQSVNIKAVNEELFLNNLNTMDVDITNTDDTVREVTESLYQCC